MYVDEEEEKYEMRERSKEGSQKQEYAYTVQKMNIHNTTVHVKTLISIQILLESNIPKN